MTWGALLAYWLGANALFVVWRWWVTRDREVHDYDDER